LQLIAHLKILNMNKLISFFALLFCFLTIHGQPKGDDILKEGQLMYRSERASWYGTDEFLSKFPDLRDSIGGYLSYEGNNHRMYNIFFGRSNPYKILARLEFDSLPKTKPISIDLNNKEPDLKERDLITIRQDAINKVRSNSDNFFTFYQNSSLNFIPMISPKERNVYIITGPQKSGIVMLGNDYLLKYDSQNSFLSKQKIHKTMIQFTKSDTTTIESSYHSHVISDLIDPTDICTLLLYKDIVGKQHYVISKKYVSIFDIEKQKLTIMKKKDWEKISKARK
jgi:hypothetical protein